MQRWQNRLNGLWSALAGGCNLNRDVPELLREGGFHVDCLDTMYLPSTPRVAGFNFWGSATPA